MVRVVIATFTEYHSGGQGTKVGTCLGKGFPMSQLASEASAEIGATVSRLMREQGLKPETVAILSGLKYAHVRAVMSGRNEPKAEALLRIAFALGVEPGSLLPDRLEDIREELTTRLGGLAEVAADGRRRRAAQRAAQRRAAKVNAGIGRNEISPDANAGTDQVAKRARRDTQTS